MNKKLDDFKELLLLTGMRESELHQIRTCDIHQTETDWIYHIPVIEGDRMVVFGPRSREILKRYLNDASPESPLFPVES